VRNIYKFQNRHLELLLERGQIERLKVKLPEYLEFNSDPQFFGTVYGSL
jgi:hypothetical protein